MNNRFLKSSFVFLFSTIFNLLPCRRLSNSLNISETARKLYIHRNTLVYRLDKIQKKTGLDVRVFEDALTFKIAMMVANHMRHMEI